MNPRKVPAALVATVMLLGACGTDDGGEVRNIDDPGGSVSISASGTGSASGTHTGSASGTHTHTGSASASGTHTGSASGTHTHTGSASGSATGSPSGSPTGTASAGPSGSMGAYMPLSDVASHARVVLDICDINALLPKDEQIDYAAVKQIYEEGGNSVKGDGSIRTIAGFARTERDEAIWNDYVSYYGDPTWLDTFAMSAIEGTGAFAGEPDLVRRQGIQKGIQNQIMIAYAIHELVVALNKAADGNFDIDSGAPHNWDEGWAFYHGDAPGCGPFATADKRGDNFGTGSAVNDALAMAFTTGVEALAAGDAAAARAASEEIVRQMTITYLQATIRYANKVDSALAKGDTGSARVSQAEGWAFYRVIEPLVAGVNHQVAAAVASRLDLSMGDPQPGTAAMVMGALPSVYAGLGISPGDIGTLNEDDLFVAAPAGIVEGEDPDVDAVVAAYRAVFDSTVQFDDKIPYLEDAESLRDTHTEYAAAAESFDGISLEPVAVVIDGDRAEVTYNVLFGGSVTYSDLAGDAVKVDGVWMVSRDRFCGFMASARVSCPSS
ncbi:MAG: hypothetical protein F4Z17_08050 [Acidimicrobiia bacterium]|nr:hypothetical protein [Acidimicrobiia bacterium]